MARLGSWWLALPLPAAAVLAAGLAFVKAGLTFEDFNVQALYVPGVQAFPAPSGEYSASLGDLLLAKVLGADTPGEWFALHLVLVAGCLIAIYLLVARSDVAPAHVLLLIFAGSSAVAALFTTVGKYDPVTILGAVLLALARRSWLRIVGLVIMLLGNPEQALVASLCLVILAAAPEFNRIARLSLACLALSAAWWGLTQLWIALAGVDSRTGLLPAFLALSLRRFFENPGLAVWSWLGVGWLTALGCVVAARGRLRWAIAGSVIGLPALVTLITADGYRVFGIVALPAFLLAAGWLWTSLASDRRFTGLVGALLLLTMLLPTSIVDFGWMAKNVGGGIADAVGSVVTSIVG